MCDVLNMLFIFPAGCVLRSRSFFDGVLPYPLDSPPEVFRRAGVVGMR